jgi:hypothetical protein
MKPFIMIAAMLLAAPAFAQNAAPPTDPTMSREQGAMPGDTTAPPGAMPTDPGANASPGTETAPASQPADQGAAAVPPAISEASGNPPSAPKDYPTCSRKIKDSCKNPGGK